MQQSFSELITPEYVQCLSKSGITVPTEIQQAAIPIIKSGKHVVGCSKTGSGKTFAYLLPIFEKIDSTIKTPQALILTPTHELAKQVHEQCKILGTAQGIGSCLIIGGANITRQMEHLKEKPKVIIGSSGRILELIRQKKLHAHTIKTIVIDEADRLLDELNLQSVNDVIKTTLRDRQLLFFSASIDEPTTNTIKKLCGEFEYINLSKSNQVPSNIEHIYFIAEQRDKTEVLRKVVHAIGITKAIAFLNNQNSIENMTKRLNFHAIKATALFGSEQNKGQDRKQALDDFKSGRATILVASDIAARGLDIKGLDHIINLDVPENPVFYLHRSGRCGRMDAKGLTITIATEHETKFIKRYESKFGISITEKDIRYGEVIDRVSK